MNIPPLPSTPSPSLEAAKPVPLPRRTNQNILTSSESESLQRDSPSPNNSSYSSVEAIYSNSCNLASNGGSSKPVPLPRKLVQRLTSTSSRASSSSSSSSASTKSGSSSQSSFRIHPTRTLEEESEYDSLDYDSIPGKPSQPVDEKRGTINIFKLASQIDDPFDTDFEQSIKDGEVQSTEFEESIKHGEILSAIHFTSPLNDLDEETRKRISTLSSSTSTTSASDDSSDHYMEPPPARPISSELAASNIMNTKRYSNFAYRNSSYPKPIKEENEFENFDDTASKFKSRKDYNKLPLTKVSSCPPSTSTATDDTMYEPISAYSSSGTSSSSGSRTNSISGVNFISSSSSANPMALSSASRLCVGGSGKAQNLSSIPTNPNFSQAKRATVPNVEKLSMSSKFNGVLNSGQDSNANLNGGGSTVHKFDATAFDISDLLRRGVSKGNSSQRSSTNSNMTCESNWSFGCKDGTNSKRRSLASPTESTDSFGSFDRSRVLLRRTSSNRSNVSSITRGGKKIHEYDDVAIEDGNVILLNNNNINNYDDNHSNSSSTDTLGNPQTPNHSNTNSGSSLTSRNSVIVEFDPLLTPNGEMMMTIKPPALPAMNRSSPSSLPSPSSSGKSTSGCEEEERILSLHLDETEQHRYEYIDTDVDEESDRRTSYASSVLDNQYTGCNSFDKRDSGSNNNAVTHSTKSTFFKESSKPVFGQPLSMDNPAYSPENTQAFQSLQFSTSHSQQNDDQFNITVTVEDQEQYEAVNSPVDDEDASKPNNLSKTPPTKPDRKTASGSAKTSSTCTNIPVVVGDAADGPSKDKVSAEIPYSSLISSEPSSSSSLLSQQSSFFRRFSNKFKLNSIREEYNVGSGGGGALTGSSSNSGSSSNLSLCKKCNSDHSSEPNGKCKFMPWLRQNVKFASNLYKPGIGIGRKDLTKKRVVLKDGRLQFLNDKQEVQSEIPLEKVAVIIKREDQKVNPTLPELKYFEMGFIHWKSTSMLIAGSSEADRDQWMRKYIEAHTATIPLTIISAFDRGGWCFMKVIITYFKVFNDLINQQKVLLLSR
jgi:hypothetical protein